MRRDEIVDIRASIVGDGAGGDYHDREKGHWLIDSPIANPMSGYADYKASRTSWGIAVLGSLVVEIETKAPFPILPDVISLLYIMSKKWSEDNQATRPVDRRKHRAGVRLIVDREREIEAFVPKEYWSIEAELRKTQPNGHAPPRPLSGGKAALGAGRPLWQAEIDLFRDPQRSDCRCPRLPPTRRRRPIRIGCRRWRWRR